MSAENRSPAWRRVDHLLFAVAIVLLATVAIWWVIFLAHTTRALDGSEREILRLQALVHETEIQGASGLPAAGPLAGDARFEVSVPWTTAAGHARAAVQPTAGALAEQDTRLARRRLMIFGEGSLLLILVGACVVMLFRLILAERRYRLEAESFVRRVTHEMKTPLAGIKALLQTLRDGRLPEDRMTEVIELGLRQAEREEHLIENLLTAHRLAVGATTLRPRPLDLAEALAAFAAHRERTMGPAESPCIVSAPASLPALADPDALATILDNLSDNAFKYGATRVDLVAARLADGAPFVQLTDDGEGFDPALADALFAPFQRGGRPGAASRHGTGLGLAISRGLAREMGGDVTARSAGPGLGATFTLVLRPAAETAS